MSDPPPGKCPECGSRKIARLVSRTSFQLRGGGWYADLYSSPQKDAKKAEPAAGNGEAAPKPAEKPAQSAGKPAGEPGASPPASAAKPGPRSGKRPSRRTG